VEGVAHALTRTLAAVQVARGAPLELAHAKVAADAATTAAAADVLAQAFRLAHAARGADADGPARQEPLRSMLAWRDAFAALRGWAETAADTAATTEIP
jgi:hypothetical protein